MRRTVIGAACLLLLGLAGQTATAAVIDGQFVPDSLVGTMQKYRLIFVTQGTTTSTSSSKAYYDDFVKAEANKDSSILKGFDYGWEAVATIGTDTGPTDLAKTVLERYPNAAVYNMGGERVAEHSEDLADLSLSLGNAVLYDQYGHENRVSVWTGRLRNYLPPDMPVPIDGAYWLGDHPTGDDTARVGYSSAKDKTWLEALPELPQNQYHAIYGISKELTAIPEPATAVLWSLFAGMAGLMYWRKRRG